MVTVAIIKLSQVWTVISKAIRVSHNEVEYDQLTSNLDELVLEVDDNPNHSII